MKRLLLAVTITTFCYCIVDFATSAQSLLSGAVQLRSAQLDGIQ
jgi:hypothetical protein